MSTFERLRSGKMNRKERKEFQQRLYAEDAGLEVVHPDAAGIDIGNASHFVAVPPDRDERPVREFGSWTADLRSMAEWLKRCGIHTVAMQSTGVYWITGMTHVRTSPYYPQSNGKIELAQIAQRRVHPAGNAAVAGGCGAAGAGLHHAEGHAGGAAAKDSRRARSEAGGGPETTANSSPASRLTQIAPSCAPGDSSRAISRRHRGMWLKFRFGNDSLGNSHVPVSGTSQTRFACRCYSFCTTDQTYFRVFAAPSSGTYARRASGAPGECLLNLVCFAKGKTI